MPILKNEEKDSIKSSLLNHLLHCNDEVNTDKLVEIVNNFIFDNNEKYFKKGYSEKTSIKILVTTGCGNTIEGGADIWTNHFIKNVWKQLPRRKNWKLTNGSTSLPCTTAHQKHPVSRSMSTVKNGNGTSNKID